MASSERSVSIIRYTNTASLRVIATLLFLMTGKAFLLEICFISQIFTNVLFAVLPVHKIHEILDIVGYYGIIQLFGKPTRIWNHSTRKIDEFNRMKNNFLVNFYWQKKRPMVTNLLLCSHNSTFSRSFYSTIKICFNLPQIFHEILKRVSYLNPSQVFFSVQQY